MGSASSVPAGADAALLHDDKLRNCLVVRAYNRRDPSATIHQQLLGLATRRVGDDVGGAVDATSGGGMLDVEFARAELGLDAEVGVGGCCVWGGGGGGGVGALRQAPLPPLPPPVQRLV